MTRTFLIAAALTATTVLAGSVNAAITYVDAVDGVSGNTYATGGSLADTSWYDTGTGANDSNDWRKRSTFGNGGVIYEGGYTIDDPELTTEIAGLADGTYNVWAFFWDASGSNKWNLAAGLTSGSLTTYSFDGLGDTSTPVAASTLSFDATPLLTESDRILYGVNLGQSVVSGGSTISVFLDNGGGSPDDRTWYDGVGYELFVPESSTWTLGMAALLGGLAACGFRRRKST